ncbi:SGNH/GDSL hydrolase family protein [Pseudoduganella lurida]|uniref:SGNH/GDSL hydrolase family protein n=1 Tax=Pseudoduganella lurida TaxID=1036180 RepID=UPI001E61693C|nr:SGNH/GDSL hydrolase family protein [Pseudoduganella lurida]
MQAAEVAVPPQANGATATGSATGWAAAWGAALMVPPAKNALPERGDVTLRQVMRLSAGGSQVRVHLSNLHGDAPLVIDAATFAPAQAGSGRIDAARLHTLRFGGAPGLRLAPGAEAVSDPLPFPAAAGQDVALSLHAAALPAQQSAHVAAHATQYVAAGNQAARPVLEGARTVTSWFQVSGIDVLAPGLPVLVAVGDSLTDGSGAGLDANERWTDFLARRTGTEGRPALAVINAGIGGNSMLRDDIGENLLARFERDVLARPGITHAVVLIGVNDLGRLHTGSQETAATRAELVARLQSGWLRMAGRAHARGVCFVAGTLMPYGASSLYRPAPHNEADRLAMNAWLRTAPAFDAVADFDGAVRDPAAPDRLLPAFDSGDHLHLSPAGYRAMAQAVPLDRLAGCRPAPPSPPAPPGIDMEDR